MDKIMRYIPGFRTNIRWKKIIAILYYLFALFSFTGGWGMGLLFLSMPFVVFSFFDLMTYKKKGKTASEVLIPFMLSVVIAIVGMIGIPTSATPAEPAANSTQLTETNVQPETTTQTATEINPADTGQADDTDKPAPTTTEAAAEQQKAASNPEPTTKSNPLKVHYLDVGQADCILIQTPAGKNILIDAGNNADGNTIASYLKSEGVKQIDVLIGTHPHEDHIGGMDTIIYSFPIGQIYMPKASSTTKTYEDVLNAIKSKGLKIKTATAGVTIDLDPSIETIMYAPNGSNYEDLNNYSAVIKLTYGNTSFMFDGDAEDVSEKEMLAKGYDLKADVLKIGHHGSSSSTLAAFLNKVNPKYAVISVGKGNNYGHPAQETMDKLKAANITVYRTDECGTIIATSNGESITFNCKPGSYNGFKSASNSSSSSTAANSSISSGSSEKSTSSGSKAVIVPTKPATSDKDRIVYWTPKGKSYHYSKDCRTLSRSKTILSGPLSECPKSDPCDICTQ